MIIYMYYWKPFRSKFSLYSSLASEIMFAGCTLILFVFVTPRSESLSYIVGWAVIALVLCSLVTSWVCVGAQQFRMYMKRRAAKAIKEDEKAAKEAEEAGETGTPPKVEIRKRKATSPKPAAETAAKGKFEEPEESLAIRPKRAAAMVGQKKTAGPKRQSDSQTKAPNEEDAAGSKKKRVRAKSHDKGTVTFRFAKPGTRTRRAVV